MCLKVRFNERPAQILYSNGCTEEVQKTGETKLTARGPKDKVRRSMSLRQYSC